METYEYVCKIDRTGNTTASPDRNLREAAMNLLSCTVQKRDFVQPISIRASRVPGLISRHHVARNAARASRPGLAVRILRVLSRGMCATRRFHDENEEHSCRVGAPMSQTACPIITGAFSFPTSSARFGGTPRSTLVKTIYCMISSLRYVIEACNMGFWSWVSLTLS